MTAAPRMMRKQPTEFSPPSAEAVGAGDAAADRLILACTLPLRALAAIRPELTSAICSFYPLFVGCSRRVAASTSPIAVARQVVFVVANAHSHGRLFS